MMLTVLQKKNIHTNGGQSSAIPTSFQSKQFGSISQREWESDEFSLEESNSSHRHKIRNNHLTKLPNFCSINPFVCVVFGSLEYVRQAKIARLECSNLLLGMGCWHFCKASQVFLFLFVKISLYDAMDLVSSHFCE